MTRLRYCAAALALLALPALADPLRIAFVGDVMLAEGPGRAIAAGGDPLAPFAAVLGEADVRIANLECAVSARDQALASKRYTFRADPGAMAVLKGRFDAVSVANNHAGDFGKTAFVDTLDLLAAAGIGRIGGGRNLAEAHAPWWIEHKGLRVAVLGYNEFRPRRFEADVDVPGVAWGEDVQILADIRAARRAGADAVIPFMHWGLEYDEAPSLRQRTLARRMIDAGATLVVGAHPHVIQPVERYRDGIVAYSLGNFVFDGFDAPEAWQGWLLQIELDKRGLVAWHTRLAHIDADGTPHPVPGALTPCGRRGVRGVGACRNP